MEFLKQKSGNHFLYHIKNREDKIWGEIVPYNDEKNTMPWRAGANKNTTISFSTIFDTIS